MPYRPHPTPPLFLSMQEHAIDDAQPALEPVGTARVVLRVAEIQPPPTHWSHGPPQLPPMVLAGQIELQAGTSRLQQASLDAQASSALLASFRQLLQSNDAALLSAHGQSHTSIDARRLLACVALIDGRTLAFSCVFAPGQSLRGAAATPLKQCFEQLFTRATPPLEFAMQLQAYGALQ